MDAAKCLLVLTEINVCDVISINIGRNLQVKKQDTSKILRERERRIARRLDPKKKVATDKPVMKAGHLHYEMSERVGAISAGGIGAIHLMAQKIGLVDDIDQRLHLLKIHQPYHESDHVLSIAYNILAGGVRLEDLELRRQDENFLNAFGAHRLPDPTTAGDFTRRFNPAAILQLQEAINAARQRVWKVQPEGFLQEAYIDVDGTIAGTLGECKGGMEISYKKIWGYAPLIVSLANTKEVLYLVNRPGNVPSHKDSAEWIDRAIALVQPHAGKITLRGDSDFTHCAHLDRWNDQGVRFIFGMDAHPKAVGLAEALPAKAWKRLERLPKYEIGTEPRTRPDNVKERIIRERGYRNIVLKSEDVAEMPYQPGKCGHSYRLIVVRKNLSVESGEDVLFADVRYFFYLTNRTDLKAEQVVGLAKGRCDQENVVAQLKSGVNAMRMPVNDLDSNWAYMVMAALAWNLKAWFALLVPDRDSGLRLLRMEFRSFLGAVIAIPAQIAQTARRLVCRFLGYTAWLKDVFATLERIRNLKHEGLSG
jgi:hypothetical protein